MELIDQIEKRLCRLPVDHYEVYLQERRVFQTESRHEKLFSLEEAHERGFAVRLFRGDRIGFAHGNEGQAAGVNRVIELALQNLAAIDAVQVFPLPSQPSVPLWTPPFDDQLRKYSHQEKFTLACRMEQVATQTDRRIARVRGAQYDEEVLAVTLRNSRGFAGHYQSSRCALSLMAVAEEGGLQESSWESDFSPHLNQLNPEKVGQGAAHKALALLGGRPVRSQTARALLGPVVASSFLGVLASSFLGDQVRKGRSALADRVGETIYSPLIHLIDDPQVLHGYQPFPFDAEGTLAERTEVVRAGVLQGFLYDGPTAGLVQQRSTGNAIRISYKEPPRVGMSNFLVQPGTATLAELMVALGDGFLISDVIGVHTADPVTGDFSLGASGYWVERGEKQGAVRGVAISGNLHELFNRVIQVGEGLRFYNNYGSPPLLISAIGISGT